MAEKNEGSVRFAELEIKNLRDVLHDDGFWAQVEKKAAEELERRFTRLRWIVAVLSLIGLGTLGTFTAYVIEKALDARLEDRVASITDTLDVMRITSTSQNLTKGESFSNTERDTILSYLRKSEGKPRLRQTPGFKANLVDVLEAFTRANLSSQVDEIFTTYERELLESSKAFQLLLHHYGQEITGVYSPTRDHFGYRAFVKLERMADAEKFPELALAYRTIFEAKATDKNTPLIHKLVQHSLNLGQSDRVWYLTQLFRRSRAENWTRKPTPQSKEIERTVKALFKDYAAVFVEHYNIPPDLLAVIAQSGVSDDDSQSISIQIVKAQESQ